MQAPRQEEDAEALRRRLRVVCGLTRLPVWQKDLKRVSAFYEPAVPGQDPVCAALCGVDAVDSASCKIREDVLYAPVLDAGIDYPRCIGRKRKIAVRLYH